MFEQSNNLLFLLSIFEDHSHDSADDAKQSQQPKQRNSDISQSIYWRFPFVWLRQIGEPVREVEDVHKLVDISCRALVGKA